MYIILYLILSIKFLNLNFERYIFSAFKFVIIFWLLHHLKLIFKVQCLILTFLLFWKLFCVIWFIFIFLRIAWNILICICFLSIFVFSWCNILIEFALIKNVENFFAWILFCSTHILTFVLRWINLTINRTETIGGDQTTDTYWTF